MRATYAVGGVAVVAVFGILGGSSASSSSAPEVLDTARAANAATVDDHGAHPLTVLLMGDSYTSGNGARDEAGNAVYYGPEGCMRSANTWGEQYARILASDGYAVTMLNRACSAATAGAMIEDRSMRDTRVVTYPEPEPAATAYGDQFYVDWAATNPRCTPAPGTEEYYVSTVNRVTQADGTANVSVACERWMPAQTQALNRDVDLVLMTVGGNDVRFPHIARECLIVANADTCAGAVEGARNYARGDFAGDLLAVFEDIEHKSEGHAKVGYAAYPGLEVNDDLRITSVGMSGVSTYAVAEQLAALSQEGLDAQREAVAQANALFGEDFVTLMDGLPQIFEGHEPDARPGFANPDRWMYEFLETTERDEWYHLKPEGHERIATHAATYGDFGARGDAAPARDLALVVDEGDGARSAVESVLAEPGLWAGAQVAVVEQRVANDGVHLERRVIAHAVDADDALAALRAASTSPWLPAPSVQLPARWNATAQSVFVGDAALSLADVAPVWSGSHQGRVVSVDTRQVDAGLAPSVLRERLAAVLGDAANAPHAWAGGPYVAADAEVGLTAQGSFGAGDLTYAWDLDGDGVYETDAADARMRVDASAVEPGWVSVRVAAAGGRASVASAWVAPAPPPVSAATPCVTSDAAVVGQRQSGRRGCRPELDAPAGPDSQAVPTHAAPALRISGSAGRDAADPGSAAGDEGRTLAALAMLPLYIDERVATAAGERARKGSRAGDPGRRRPNELVRRERALRALTADLEALR